MGQSGMTKMRAIALVAGFSNGRRVWPAMSVNVGFQSVPGCGVEEGDAAVGEQPVAIMFRTSAMRRGSGSRKLRMNTDDTDEMREIGEIYSAWDTVYLAGMR